MTPTRVCAAVLYLLAVVSAGCQSSVDPVMPMCAIDMGSNSFRRIVGVFADGRYQERAVEVRTLGVGDDLTRHGRISDAKVAEITTTLAEFGQTCRTEGAADVRAVGTAAFRDAPNGAAVVEAAKALGINVEIASEARESELAYLVASLGDSDFAVIDNGSRSIELVADVDGKRQHRVFTLGYRVAWQQFFTESASAAAAIEAQRNALARESQDAAFMRGRKTLVGVEFREMVEVLFPGGEVEGQVLSLPMLTVKLQEIAAADADQFARIKATANIDRALPRLVAAEYFVRTFGYGEIRLTRRELGTGLIIEAGIARKK